MGSSLIVISLALGTLLIGIVIAAYQLWSTNKSQEQGEHSALAKRFGGQVSKRFEPIDRKLTQDPRGQARNLNATSNPEAEAALRP